MCGCHRKIKIGVRLWCRSSAQLAADSRASVPTKCAQLVGLKRPKSSSIGTYTHAELIEVSTLICRTFDRHNCSIACRYILSDFAELFWAKLMMWEWHWNVERALKPLRKKSSSVTFHLLKLINQTFSFPFSVCSLPAYTYDSLLLYLIYWRDDEVNFFSPPFLDVYGVSLMQVRNPSIITLPSTRQATELLDL